MASRKRIKDQAPSPPSLEGSDEEATLPTKKRKLAIIPVPPEALTCRIVKPIGKEQAKNIEWSYGGSNMALEEVEDRVRALFLVTDPEDASKHRLVLECVRLDERGKIAGKPKWHVLIDVYGLVSDLPPELRASAEANGAHDEIPSPLLAAGSHAGLFTISRAHYESSDVKVHIPKWSNREPSLERFLTRPKDLVFWQRPATEKREAQLGLYLEVPPSNTYKDHLLVQVAYDIQDTVENVVNKRLARSNTASSNGPREAIL